MRILLSLIALLPLLMAPVHAATLVKTWCFTGVLTDVETPSPLQRGDGFYGGVRLNTTITDERPTDPQVGIYRALDAYVYVPALRDAWSLFGQLAVQNDIDARDLISVSMQEIPFWSTDTPAHQFGFSGRGPATRLTSDAIPARPPKPWSLEYLTMSYLNRATGVSAQGIVLQLFLAPTFANANALADACRPGAF